MIKTLVIDQFAVEILDAALIEEEWFRDFFVPQNTQGLRRVMLRDTVYLLSEDADEKSVLLVVRVGQTGVFEGPASPRYVFERILRVALHQVNRNIALPIQWQAYHEGALISIYAEPSGRKTQYRIHLDQAPDGSANIYAYAVIDQPRDFKTVPEDIDAYRDAISCFVDAILTDDDADMTVDRLDRPVGHFGILLSEPLGIQFGGQASLKEWYDRKLNQDQRRFVDQPTIQPIRLRGAAGTGKTQSMAVKCLRELYTGGNDDNLTKDKTIAFLTHSSALAHEVIRGMLKAMDPSERWANLKTPAKQPCLWMGTLYELAQEKLNYEKKGLKPLSLDGSDGRELQRMLIGDAIDKVRRNPRHALDVLKKCPDLNSKLADERARPRLVEELMNEFACILDAENIRKGTNDAERYIRGAREKWQLDLPTVEHRQVVLEIHDLYREALKKERLLSIDQMIGDFAHYLSTNEWTEQLRDQVGFDVIFVDEYHYFTRVEAMTLHNLFKSRAENSGRWPLIMAYDLKQSTNDVAIAGGLERFRNPGVGESVPVELTEVFRSTPQIAAFLHDLDGAFPGLDLEGEFETYTGTSRNPDGAVPSLLEFDKAGQLLDAIFSRAGEMARSLEGGGSQVAVLCLNDELFEQYRKAGRIRGKYVAVTSREDLRELRYARARCVFSMPDYVAGLQFDTVFLINVDRADLDIEHVSQGARRRYVTRAYLGASRARNKLYIATSRDRGGPSEILNGPIRNRTLVHGS